MIAKGSQSLEKYNRNAVLPVLDGARHLEPAQPLLPRLMTRITPLIALGLGAMAFADDDPAASTASLANTAKTGMTGIVAAVVVLLLIGIGIRALWFGNGQVKKGIAKSS